MANRKKDLKERIEDEISDMLKEKKDPSETRMKLLKLGIAYLAVNAKLSESDYGGFFEDGDTGVPTQEGPKPRVGGRKNGAGLLGVEGSEAQD